MSELRGVLNLTDTLTVAALIERLQKMPPDTEVPTFRIEFKFPGARVTMQRKRQPSPKKKR